MIAIQVILIAAVVLALLMFLRHHGKTKTTASIKIGFVLFLIFAVIAVLFPDMVSLIANALGVGRGTDLLLYMLVVAFGFATINTYLRFKDLEDRYAKLVRAIALRDRERPQPDAAGESDRHQPAQGARSTTDRRESEDEHDYPRTVAEADQPRK